MTRTLVVEIMGRHSNIILRTEDGRIIDAARHVGQDISRVRQVMPGLPYAYPPTQGKLDPETADAEAVASALENAGGKLEKAIGASIAGFSPQAAREAAVRIGMDGSALVSEINVQAAANALCDYFHQMPSLSPCVVTLDDLGAPTDVFPFPQKHLPTGKTAQFDDPSAALDAYFYERDRRDRLNQRSASLAHTIKIILSDAKRKLPFKTRHWKARHGWKNIVKVVSFCRPISIDCKRAKQLPRWKTITAKTANLFPFRWMFHFPLLRMHSDISNSIKKRGAQRH